MNSNAIDELEDALVGEFIKFQTDSFNRAMKVLRDAGAVDTSAMSQGYKGICSEYYDLVTDSFERTSVHARASIRKVLVRKLG